MSWLDTDAAQKHLGYRTRKAFYRAIHAHGIPFVKIGSSLRFSEAKLEAYMDVQRQKQTRVLPMRKVR